MDKKCANESYLPFSDEHISIAQKLLDEKYPSEERKLKARADMADELANKLQKYNQIVRITIQRLVRQYGNENDEYAEELRECLHNACETLEKHDALKERQ